MTDTNEVSQEQFEQEENEDFLASSKGEYVEEEKEPEIEPEVLTEEQDIEKLVNDLPQEAMERLAEKLGSKFEEKFSPRLRNIEGHIGGMKDNILKLSAAKKAVEEQGADAPSKGQIASAMEDGTKLKQLKEDFPEWADAISEVRDAVIKRIPNFNEAKFNERLDRSEKMAREAIQESFVNRQKGMLDYRYPGWEQEIVSKDYGQWLISQPKEVQELTNSNNASDALKVLDAFHEYKSASNENAKPDLTAQSRQNKQNRLENSVVPTNGRSIHRSQPKTEHEEFLEAAARARGT